MSLLFQPVAVAFALTYLLWRAVHHHRHSNREWDAIVRQLRAGTSRRDQLHNSGLALELIHYADRHGMMDALLLAKVRREAVQARLRALGLSRPGAAD